MVFFHPRPEGSGSKWWLMVVMSVSARELVTESIQDLIRVSDEPHGIITETLHTRSVKTRRVTLHRSAVNNHIIHLVHEEPPHLCCCTPAHIHMDFFHKEKKNSVFYVCQIYTIGPVINNLFQLSSCEVQKVLPRSQTHKTLIFLRESGAARSDHSLSRQPDTDPILLRYDHLLPTNLLACLNTWFCRISPVFCCLCCSLSEAWRITFRISRYLQKWMKLTVWKIKNTLSLSCFQWSLCQKGRANYHIMFFLCLTQRHNFYRTAALL